MKITSVPVRLFMVNIPTNEAYSLESVGKNGFCKLTVGLLFMFMFVAVPKYFLNVSYAYCASFTALEVGPQPHGVVRADIYNYMKEALELAIEWIGLFNSGTKISRPS